MDRLPASVFLALPFGSAGKESACNEGDLGSIPGLGRSLGEGKGYPHQYSGLENSMACIVHGAAKSQTRPSDFHFHRWTQISSSLLLKVGAQILCDFRFGDPHRRVQSWSEKPEEVLPQNPSSFSAHVWPLPWGAVASAQVNPGGWRHSLAWPILWPHLDQLPWGMFPISGCWRPGSGSRKWCPWRASSGCREISRLNQGCQVLGRGL